MTPEDAVRAYFAAYSDYRGLSLYRVAGGRVTEIRQALIGRPPD